VLPPKSPAACPVGERPFLKYLPKPDWGAQPNPFWRIRHFEDLKIFVDSHRQIHYFSFRVVNILFSRPLI
jgi:hypothetical protein